VGVATREEDCTTGDGAGPTSKIEVEVTAAGVFLFPSVEFRGLGCLGGSVEDCRMALVVEDVKTGIVVGIGRLKVGVELVGLLKLKPDIDGGVVENMGVVEMKLELGVVGTASAVSDDDGIAVVLEVICVALGVGEVFKSAELVLCWVEVDRLVDNELEDVNVEVVVWQLEVVDSDDDNDDKEEVEELVEYIVFVLEVID